MDFNGILFITHKHWVPWGETVVNQNHYKEILEKLVIHVLSNFLITGFFIIIIRYFILCYFMGSLWRLKAVCYGHILLFFPALTLYDLFLFSKLKLTRKRYHFETKVDIQRAWSHGLNGISQYEFQKYKFTLKMITMELFKNVNKISFQTSLIIF